MRIRRWTTVGAALAVLAAAPAAHAQGGLLGGLGGTVTGAADEASNTLCEPVSGVNQQAGQVACALDALTFKFRTVYDKPGGGTIVSEVDTAANVSTPLDVDADPLPDLFASVKVLALDNFSMHVERAPGETAALPALVEALVDDPLGSLPRERIAIGFDARGGKAPKGWHGEIDLVEMLEHESTIGLTFTKTGDTPKLAIVGGLFDGADAGNRQNPIGARLDYAPVPAQVGATLAIGDTKPGEDVGDTFAATLTTPTPAKLTAGVDYVDGPLAMKATTTIDKLPSSLEIAYANPATDKSDVTYDASSIVTSVGIEVKRLNAGALETHAIANLEDVPTGVTVHRTSKTAGSISTTGAGLGSAAVAFGERRSPAIPAVDEPYVASETTGTFESPGDGAVPEPGES